MFHCLFLRVLNFHNGETLKNKTSMNAIKYVELKSSALIKNLLNLPDFSTDNFRLFIFQIINKVQSGLMYQYNIDKRSLTHAFVYILLENPIKKKVYRNRHVLKSTLFLFFLLSFSDKKMYLYKTAVLITLVDVFLYKPVHL